MNISTEKMTETIEQFIDGITDINDKQKGMIRVIMNNVCSYIDNKSNGEFDLTEYETLINSNLRAAETFVMELSKIVGVQPISFPVGMCYSLQTTKNGVNNNGKILTSFEISSSPVECATINLTNNNTIEERSCFGLEIGDINSVKNANDDFSTQILKLVLDNIVKLSTPSFSKLEPKDLVVRESGIANYMFEINKACSNIAATTLRGMGNVMIIDSTFLEYLKRDHFFKPVNNLEEIKEYKTSKLTPVGVYASTTVYCSELYQNKIIIGYVGNPYDTGYIVTPRIPVIVNDTNTYCSVYGQFVNKILSEPAVCGKGYYRMIDIQYTDENTH